jgi:hypothetical protein
MYFSHGATIDDLEDDEDRLAFQITLLQTQMHLEDAFLTLAKNCHHPAVVICDRGAMDGKAYMEEEVCMFGNFFPPTTLFHLTTFSPSLSLAFFFLSFSLSLSLSFLLSFCDFHILNASKN